MMGKTYTHQERARVLEAAAEGRNWRLVALHNEVELETARHWVHRARKTGDFTAPLDRRGGSYNRKIEEHHLEYSEECLSENCHLTLREMQDRLLEEFGIRVGVQTVRANLDGRCFTLKKTHRDNNYRNTPENKLKRQEFAIKLLQYVAAEKKILYLDETNFNIWVSRSYGWSKAGTRAVDFNTSSKGRNIHVIATISREGVEYHEGRFGSFDNAAANEYVRAMLRDQATREPLSNVVVVVDNAPCHSRIEDVFDEAEFAGAECLRLGPYSPMLNGFENVFSAYKAAVKRYVVLQCEN
ncbi:hypothetical protein PF003_g36477 [Phytophthora fragariae]|nr:hypothetical protein PF003_g36477 [Phytophthora fragariae]